MTSTATVNCRGINLLELGRTRDSKGVELHVSVHQLSLYIWELFKVPRGSVQKKIKDLGIILRPCTKESVQILREHCVITAYKACQLTLEEAELVFDAVQKSRQRRVNSEKRKQEHAEKRWLQKMDKKSNDKSKTDGGVEDIGNGLVELDGDENVDECALYRTSPPPTTAAVMQGGVRNGVKNWEPMTNGKLKVADTGAITGVGVPFKYSNGKKAEEEVVEELQDGMAAKNDIGNSTSKCSLWGRKKALMNGYKNHINCTSRNLDGLVLSTKTLEKNGQSSELSDCSEDYCLSSSGIENSHVFSCSGSEEGLDSSNGAKTDIVSRLELKEEPVLQEQTRIYKKRKLHPPLPKRIVKLRHFAQTTSPKVKTTISKPPCPSLGKHFPGVCEASSKTAAHESLVVSIPKSLLAGSCNKIFSSGDGPACTTLMCSSHGQKSRLRSYRGKVKETALSTFASKKRASTHTPSPPVESLPEKHSTVPVMSSVRSKSQEVLSSCRSPTPGPLSVQSGAEVNIVSMSCPSNHHKLNPHKRRGSHKSNLSSSSSSPQPVMPLTTLDSQSLQKSGSEFDNVADSEMMTRALGLCTANVGGISHISEHRLVDIAPSNTKKQTHGVASDPKNLSSCPQLGKDDEGFCFRKHFDCIPPKLVVRNGELCPEVSLSLKGVRLNDIPSNHPIWTWKIGQPTKKHVPPVFKPRTTRLKSTKSKAPVL